jgi:hypothetical protein
MVRPLLVAVGLVALLLWGVRGVTPVQAGAGTIPPLAPVLHNGDFECTTGYYSATNAAGRTIYVPNQWRLVLSQGAPKTHSARINFARSCDGSAHVERILGIDSILVEAQDLERPPEPGKPFDASFYQQVTATVGGSYSLSGWALSLCGGSTVPSDCPAGNHIAKMIGIDPTGGIDPLANTVIWAEDRRNFVENNQRVGWTNVRLGAVAEAMTITVFARLASPFQWHGNHGFLDALSLVRSPVATLALPAEITGTALIVLWESEQSPDIAAIPGGNYELAVDLQVRHVDATEWRDWLMDQSAIGSQVFSALCVDTSYEFRIRARAEQPAGEDGAWPNHRYPGVWSTPVRVFFHSVPDDAPGAGGPLSFFLPVIRSQRQC